MSVNLDSLKKQAASANTQDVQYRALEREAKAQRDLLEALHLILDVVPEKDLFDDFLSLKAAMPTVLSEIKAMRLA